MKGTVQFFNKIDNKSNLPERRWSLLIIFRLNVDNYSKRRKGDEKDSIVNG